jgi:hypothetical protein
MGEENAPYYPLGQRSLICTECVLKLMATHIGGLLEQLQGIQQDVYAKEQYWTRKAQEIYDVMAFDVDTMPEDVMRQACKEVQRIFKERGI